LLNLMAGGEEFEELEEEMAHTATNPEVS
jgi:hypothetical protein